MRTMREITIASEFITLSDAARRLGISRPTLYLWIAHGRLTRYRVGGEPKLLRAEVEREAQTLAIPPGEQTQEKTGRI